MSRAQKIAIIAAVSALAIVFLLFLAVVVLVRTAWFHNEARERVAAFIGEAAGGRAEIGRISIYPERLSAEVTDFVLHGAGPSGGPPLFRAKSIRFALDPGAAVRGRLEGQSLVIDQPVIHIRVEPDGSTNLPRSARRSQGGTSPLRRVMELAFGRFEATNGLLVVDDRKIPLNLRGENVHARFLFDSAVPRYTGGISAAPIHVAAGGNPALPLDVNIPLEVSSSALTITNARFDAPDSRVRASARFTDLGAPRGSVWLNGRIALPELARSFRPSLAARTEGTPPLDVSAAASLDGNQARIEMLNLAMGHSSLDASGALASVQPFRGTFQFTGDFTMQELKTLLNLPQLGTGTVHVTGTATTGPGGFDVKAKFSASEVAFNGGKADISSDVHVAADGKVSLTNIHVAALGGTFDGGAEIIDRNRFVLDGALSGVDLRQAAAASGVMQAAWSGAVSGPVHAEGELRGPIASRLIAGARLDIAPRGGGIPVSGLLDVAYNGSNNSLSFGNSFLALPSTRVDFSGAVGNRLNIRAVSRDLNDLRPLLALPVELANGEAAFNGTVTGGIANPRIDGRVAVTNFIVNQQKFDRLTAAVQASTNGAAVRNAILTQGQLQANLDASIGLVNWKPQATSPIVGSASLRNAQIELLLAAAGRPAPPVSGTLFANAKVAGTFGDPRAGLGLTVRNGAAFGEPFDTAQAQAVYTAGVLQLTSAQVTGPYGRLQASATFRHPAGDLSTGQLEFHAGTSALQLNHIRAVSARRPELSGVIELTADGAGTLRPAGSPLPFLFSRFDAKLAASSLAISGRPAGSLLLTAQTRGSSLDFALRSDIAGSDIRGNGTWQLAGDYPVQARVVFSPVEIGAIARLVSTQPDGITQNIDGTIAGVLTVSGPAIRPRDLAGKLELSTVEIRPSPNVLPAGSAQSYVLRNAGPVVVSLSQSELRVQPARIIGPSTDLTFGGAVYPNRRDALDIRASGRIGLELAGMLHPDLSSTGVALLDATVQGRLSRPDVNGRLQVRNASLNFADFPNGISNANGVILFSGTQAVIQQIAGEMGGGKVMLDGTVHYGGPAADFRLQASANEVRIDYPERVSTRVNAKLALGGTTNSSVLSGDVTVLEMVLRTDTDIGALLAPGGPPATAPAAQTGLLGGMRLDVHIETAPDIQFFTALAQNLEADGSLQLRGTPGQPGMLGRINVTQGEILFFGNKYTINRGTISFFNPQRIEPIVDVALETKARGITVTVLASGPADRLKLTYSSDPPLLFSDVVGLLATGRTVSSDPVLAARQLPSTPEQSFQQIGASAILSQAIANPVAGRLQRLFGISQLTINPQIVGTALTPQTQVILEQQVSSSFSFVYIQTLTEANPQTIRLEWAIDPKWSAVGVREEDGRFAIDLYYKKSFR